jgi:hypothetical protein
MSLFVVDGRVITAHTRPMSYAMTGRVTGRLPYPRQIHTTASGTARFASGVVRTVVGLPSAPIANRAWVLR